MRYVFFAAAAVLVVLAIVASGKRVVATRSRILNVFGMTWWVVGLVFLVAASIAIGADVGAMFGLRELWFGDPASDEFYSEDGALTAKLFVLAVGLLLARMTYALGYLAREEEVRREKDAALRQMIADELDRRDREEPEPPIID